MFPQVGEQTVLIFKVIQFRGQWSRSFPLNMTDYLALKDGLVIVLIEDRAGNNVTHFFALKKGDEVMVSYADSQVHIPALCVLKASGDRMLCGRTLKAVRQLMRGEGKSRRGKE